MRYWTYNEQDDGDGHTVTVSDAEILRTYWNYWQSLMVKVNTSRELITEENCIQDYVTVNWAWETYQDGTSIT